MYMRLVLWSIVAFTVGLENVRWNVFDITVQNVFFCKQFL